jgi:hypothetical protein
MKILVHSFRDALLAQWLPALMVSPATIGTAVAAPADLPAPQRLATADLPTPQKCGVKKIPTSMAQGGATSMAGADGPCWSVLQLFLTVTSRCAMPTENEVFQVSCAGSSLLRVSGAAHRWRWRLQVQETKELEDQCGSSAYSASQGLEAQGGSAGGASVHGELHFSPPAFFLSGGGNRGWRCGIGRRSLARLGGTTIMTPSPALKEMVLYP